MHAAERVAFYFLLDGRTSFKRDAFFLVYLTRTRCVASGEIETTKGEFVFPAGTGRQLAPISPGMRP